jgi:hypothetical protein
MFLAAHVQFVATFVDDIQGQGCENDETNQNFVHGNVSKKKPSTEGGL